MEENDCKNARLRRKLVLQQRFNARSNQHADYKEQNARKKPKIANHCSQNKRSESDKLVHNSIQRKPLQELHLIEDPIQINLMTSQSAASTITYNTPCAIAFTEVMYKIITIVVQVPHLEFNLHDETTTEQHCSDTRNDDSTRTTYEGDSTSTTITNELYCKGELQGKVTQNCTEFHT
ncbi:hypothetical protein DEO72_LG11g1915 [Vigna unguiculata]|uniref:Uncharacterized protein n=1 Tax=Vigna unguiculata TaxID=3917 RepID=A0A4D6NQX5_VIGUN|nr:hypothetical protein DEO72_LG11g1915 [Vigna unguiculata]